MLHCNCYRDDLVVTLIFVIIIRYINKFTILCCVAACAGFLDASQAPLLEGRPAAHAQTNQIPNVSSCLRTVVIMTGVLYSSPVAVRCIVINPSVCVSVCPRAYLWNRWTDPHEILCRSPVTMARSSSGGVALRHVLPVLWMTSRLAVMGGMALRSRPDLLLAVSVRDRGGV